MNKRPYIPLPGRKTLRRRTTLALAGALAALVAGIGLVGTSGYLLALCALAGAGALGLGGGVFAVSGPVRFFALVRPVADYFGQLYTHELGSAGTNRARRRLFDGLRGGGLAVLPRATGGAGMAQWTAGVLAAGRLDGARVRRAALIAVAFVLVFAGGAFGLYAAAAATAVAGGSVALATPAYLRAMRRHAARADRRRRHAYAALDNVYAARDWLVAGGQLEVWRARATAAGEALAEEERRGHDFRSAVTAGVRCGAGVYLCAVLWSLLVAYAAEGTSALVCVGAALAALLSAGLLPEWLTVAETIDRGRAVRERLDDMPAGKPAGGRVASDWVAGDWVAGDRVESDRVEGDWGAGDEGAVTGFGEGPPSAPPRGHVRLRGLWYRYAPDAPWLLRDLSLDLTPASVHLLTGENGTGKSTLLHLLAGLLPGYEGTYLLDGRNVAAAPADYLGARVTLLPQRPHVFQDTLAANLRLGAADATTEDLRRALEAVALLDWAEALPAGLDTPLTGQDARLSSGQARRLALARLLLRPRSILLLDEPTEGLDAGAEARVLQTLRRLSRAHALVIATHRPDKFRDFPVPPTTHHFNA